MYAPLRPGSRPGCVKHTLPPTGLTLALQSNLWIKANRRGSRAQLEQLQFFLSNTLKPVVLIIFFLFVRYTFQYHKKIWKPATNLFPLHSVFLYLLGGLTVFRQDLSARRRTHRSSAGLHHMASFPELLIPRYKCACHRPQLLNALNTRAKVLSHSDIGGCIHSQPCSSKQISFALADASAAPL